MKFFIRYFRCLSIFFFLLFIFQQTTAQNDDCAGASPVIITNGGFALGLFTSNQSDLTTATLQSGETFAPSINTAGLNKKSVWYKFSLPTTRAAKISLAQPGSGIQAGNVGFAVYKISTCLPGNGDISTKFSPIEIFGSSFHPCVDAGDYLVQVTSNLIANGPVFITLELGEPSPALYDKPADAYQFTNINTNKTSIHDFLVQCQTIDDAAENCLPATSFKGFTKSTWHTFTTPAYFDWLSVLLTAMDNNSTVDYLVGYRIYQGNARITPVASLTLLGGCDSMKINGYSPDKKVYRCGELLPNTTYSVQLLYHKDFTKTLRMAVAWSGVTATKGPQPVSSLPTPNNMGTLNANSAGLNNLASDTWGCNSRHNQYSCPRAMPVAGVVSGSQKYTLSSFFSFTLASTSTLAMTVNQSCSPAPLVRLYKQGLTANCTDLDTANIISVFGNYSPILTCLDPGNYVLQVMGIDSTVPRTNYHWSSFSTTTSALCLQSHLGATFNLTINAKTEVATNKFSLNATGQFNKVNANGAGIMQPLVPYTIYNMPADTFGCANTVLPDGSICFPNYTKAAYREFLVDDSLMFHHSVAYNVYPYGSGLLYKGDANSLATAQNVFSFPQKITGLVANSNCLGPGSGLYASSQAGCVVPGTYTFASFDYRVGVWADLKLAVTSTKTIHATPATAQDMGDLWSYMQSNTYYRSDLDTFTCRDNADTIGGLAPCIGQYGFPSKKLIYRQFYLSKPTSISIVNWNGSSGFVYGYGRFNLFKGKATDGLGTLLPVGAPWTCFTSASTPTLCDALPAGWYTLVSYGSGPNYADPLANLPAASQNSDVGMPNCFYIRLAEACAAPKFNRPSKASIDTLTGQPYKIEWGPQTGHTTAYPVTGKTYTLNRENFDCSNDTAFIKQYMKGCNTTDYKVAFFVFKTTQEAYVRVSQGSGYEAWSTVYAFDVRTVDSTRLKTDNPLQPCLLKDGIEFCKLQPGTYTLIVFGRSDFTCNSVTPVIYIDQTGQSRFDHASNAYDFGALTPDSTWRNGKPGDINPLDAGRAPSNDFFYCTTGAQEKDPTDATCFNVYNPNIYPTRNNAVLNPDNAKITTLLSDRRNLWYSFVINQPGTVKVKVDPKTPNKYLQNVFAVYKSDVDASIPWNTLETNGLVDSTLLQGLQLAGTNLSPGYYCTGPSYIQNNIVSFNVAPCDFTPTRYFVLVETRTSYRDPWYWGEHMIPNYQVEVSALLDSVSFIPPKFDHYSQANDLGLVNSGIKKGETDNFTCATRDLPDPLNSYTTCQKTLWYKFTTTTTGQIRYAAFFKGTNQYYYDHIQLFRQIKPNDSSATGLQHMPYTAGYTNNGTWAQQCISPGTYYIILPGCNAIDEDVYPQIEIIPQAGDFCSAPMVTGLTGPGTRVVPVTIDCHTIGTDYGEFNPTLTCPANATTSNYKTSWYRLDITGTDTLDVTVYINENTNATSTDIKYRMMTGSCGAMQEQSCVQDALTRNTYKCLAPGNSYYIQVFTPTFYNSQPTIGTIDLNLSAVVHADSCFPANNCIGVANFTPKFDCTKDKAALFTNFSTYGSSITYDWDFGHNNQTSSAVSPSYFYPALTTAATYTVKLVITNTTAGCNKKDSSIQTITIPARPAVNLGRDTLSCTNGITIPLNATSHAGSTYYWYNGSTQPTFTHSGIGNPWVEVTYNGCKTRDTINIWINPIAKQALQTKALCNVTTVTLTGNRGYGEQYTWNTGASTNSITVAQPGYYWVDLYLNGCTVRDSFLVVSADLKPLGNDKTLCQRNMPFIANATVNGATSYRWQNNSTSPTLTVTQPGLYWVDIALGGCTFRDTLVVAVDSFKTATVAATICHGQFYTLSSGQLINSAGIYKDTLRNIRGCDSMITNLTLRVDTVRLSTSSASICTGQTYTLPSGALVNQGGTYRDTLRYNTGCDSVITTLALTVSSVTAITRNPSICQGQSYVLPSGQSASVSGTYIDTIRNAGVCDSIITTVLVVKTVSSNALSPTICHGQTYTLPSGLTVNATGIYRDTLRYATGCDSVRSTINLTVKPVITSTLTPSICEGQSYTLPSGIIITAAGLYRDTLRYVTGCDSLRSTIDLNIKSLTRVSSAAAVCAGQSYLLPSGTVVNSSGLYNDTLRYVAGCDSVIHAISLTVKPLIRSTASLSVCAGQTYTLPWGTVVSGAGIYIDTTRYASGCDSLIQTITLRVDAPLVQNTAAVICDGQNFTLPWGVTVSVAGTYRDTIKYLSGCDSLVRTISISVRTTNQQTISATICSGQTYALPWGSVVSLPGIYRDTLRYAAGCDSVWREVTLAVKTALQQTTAVTICENQTYTLPWGAVATTPGIYRDTLRYSGGCDSLIRIVNLSKTVTTMQASLVSICQGQNYSLPWGINVSTSGIYRDTIRTATGCDSILRMITLDVKPITRQLSAFTICTGQNFTLPWGTVVSTSGIYQDTLRYLGGCDSMIRTVDLTIKPLLKQVSNITICSSQSYTLPWGTVVNIAGTYSDTSRYNSGCDSLIRFVMLKVDAPLVQSNSAAICEGQTYALPWGPVVSLTGIYRDTVRYASGCDSLVRSVSLVVQRSSSIITSESICAGQTYVLPWGTSVSVSGIYRDTLRYPSGCDSLVRTVNLAVKTVTMQNTTATVCSGQSYVLPWGTVVSVAGLYRDTLHYTSGCDSIITTVVLQVTAPAAINFNPSICTGETYTLPWGGTVSAAGTYRNVIQTANGCDSLVQTVLLTVNALPAVQLTKSNDINCMLGTTALTASGGVKYLWSPVTGLSNPTIANPIAAPATSTMYKVSVTHNNGCTKEDSIYVTVAIGNPAEGYPVASAFTPNNDGKNDCFGISHWGDVKNVEFFIYNRWGQMMFYTTNRNDCWDGKFSGVAQKTDVYVYVIKANTVCGPVLRKGTVTVIR